jgi:Rieske Fe-S protein
METEAVLAEALERPTDLDSPARRKFFGALLAGAGAASAALLAPALVRLGLAPLVLPRGSDPLGIDIGQASDFADTASGAAGPREVVVQQRLVDGYMTTVRKLRVTVVRDAASPSRLAALSTSCTHLGCGVTWDAEKSCFLCPCHGGAYGPEGSVLSGPPPRALDRFAVKVDGGRLRVYTYAQA